MCGLGQIEGIDVAGAALHRATHAPERRSDVGVVRAVYPAAARPAKLLVSSKYHPDVMRAARAARCCR